MSHCAVTLEELLADFNETAARWQAFFTEHPKAADSRTDIAHSTRVSDLVWHAYSVACRHSQRLLGETPTDFGAAYPQKGLDSAWKLRAEASENLTRFLAQTSDEDVNSIFTYKSSTGGEVSASYRKLCLHLFVHTIRHLAQVGPIVRQNGFTPSWGQDIFFSSAIR